MNVPQKNWGNKICKEARIVFLKNLEIFNTLVNSVVVTYAPRKSEITAKVVRTIKRHFVVGELLAIKDVAVTQVLGTDFIHVAL